MTEDDKPPEVEDQKEEIKDLIRQENDSERRALLLLLDAINDNLVEHARYVRSLAIQQEKLINEFDAHVKTDAAIQNQLKGGSKVAKVMVNAIRVVTLAACTLIYNDIRSIHSELNTDKLEHQVFKDQFKAIERKSIK